MTCNFVVHSNEMACRKRGRLGLDPVINREDKSNISQFSYTVIVFTITMKFLSVVTHNIFIMVALLRRRSVKRSPNQWTWEVVGVRMCGNTRKSRTVRISSPWTFLWSLVTCTIGNLNPQDQGIMWENQVWGWLSLWLLLLEEG